MYTYTCIYIYTYMYTCVYTTASHADGGALIGTHEGLQFYWPFRRFCDGTKTLQFEFLNLVQFFNISLHAILPDAISYVCSATGK